MIQKRIIDSFEEEFAAYIGTKYAIGTSMGRTALFAVLNAIGVEENDEIIMPAYICEVVPNSVLKLKGVPIFVDINLTDYHISVSHLQTLINSRTKAIIIDHIFGYPEDVDVIKEIIDKSGQKIFLIEDAAHALGADYKGKKVGSLCDVAIFSLSKNMFNFGGGAITTNNDIIARKAKEFVINSTGLSFINQVFFGMFSYFDRRKVNSKLFNRLMELLEFISKKFQFGRKDYDQSLKIPATFSMSKLQAFVFLYQLKKMNYTNAKMIDNQAILDKMLCNFNSIDILSSKIENSKHVCTWYVIRIKDPEVHQRLTGYCKKSNVFLSTFWDPLCSIQLYNKIQTCKDVPNSLTQSKCTLIFKMNPCLSESELKKIAMCLKNFITGYIK